VDELRDRSRRLGKIGCGKHEVIDHGAIMPGGTP
jgi:hypothetical protein